MNASDARFYPRVFALVTAVVLAGALSLIVRAGDILDIPIVSRAIRWAEALAPVDAEQIQGWLMSGAQTLLQGLVVGPVVVALVLALLRFAEESRAGA